MSFGGDLGGGMRGTTRSEGAERIAKLVRLELSMPEAARGGIKMTGAIEEGGRVATTTVEALKTQPLALALVVVNVMFLIFGGYFLHDLAGTNAAAQMRKDALLSNLAERCMYSLPGKKDDDGK